MRRKLDEGIIPQLVLVFYMRCRSNAIFIYKRDRKKNRPIDFIANHDLNQSIKAR
jgi:hypothetical protein